MPVKATRVENSYSPGHLNRLLTFGRKHNLQSTDGKLRPSKIQAYIINYVLGMDDDTDVQNYLERHGGTVVDLIRRAVKRYVST